jgi:aminoglycoside/choline kinase family phosphotransferase
MVFQFAAQSLGYPSEPSFHKSKPNLTGSPLQSFTESVADADPRAAQAYAWACGALKLAQASFAPASADASFRRYFRIRSGAQSWIVMDAPPQQEDCGPFVRIARLLQEAGVHVPAILAQDLDHGFLLLSDLGTQTLLDVIDEANADALFGDAIDALIVWQRASRPQLLPPYDEVLLRRELKLFPDWYLERHLGVVLDAAGRDALESVFRQLVDNALAQPQVYVHRDYMPRNLMLSRPNPGVLDFQDAVYGPLAYDPISLFKDAFLSWPASRVEWGLRTYHTRAEVAGLAVPPWPQFRRDCDWIGVQRHLKILGIFARLTLRDGKPRYLDDTPRFVRYVMDVLPYHPELKPLAELFEQHVLPRLSPAA